MGIDLFERGIDVLELGIDSSDRGIDLSEWGIDLSEWGIDSSDRGIDSFQQRHSSWHQQVNQPQRYADGLKHQPNRKAACERALWASYKSGALLPWQTIDMVIWSTSRKLDPGTRH